jgi:NAD(P)H-flavin reductase
MTEQEGWEGETRQLDADVLRELLGGLDDKQFLVAGPAPMAKGVSESLLAAGLPEGSVLADAFSGY